MKTILVATSDREAIAAISNCFVDTCHSDVAESREDIFSSHQGRHLDYLFLDVDFISPESGGDSRVEGFRELANSFPSAEIIVMAPQEKTRVAVDYVKEGAGNYLNYPIDVDEAKLVVENLNETLMLKERLDYLDGEFWKGESLELIQTNSPAMREVFRKVRSVAPTKTTVLLTGETGVGKGLVARLIHQHSSRSEKSFVAVHCGAIPDNLIESELFGHERGSFTGAVKRKLGKFEIAQKGTLFLDEVGTVSASAQIKLLQVLQDHVFHRVGGESDIESDVRIIAATNEDLKEMLDRGEFRTDLYYRLGVFPIEIPPLRDRREDLPRLVQALLQKFNQYHSKKINSVHPAVLDAFMRYLWPGNIRELENLIERAYIIETNSYLTPESFPSELFGPEAGETRVSLDTSMKLAEVRKKAVENVEAEYLKELLVSCKGRINHTAKAAGLTPRQLNNLMKKHGLQKKDFKVNKKEK